MRCRTVLTSIDSLRTGEIENLAHSEVEAHLKTCGSCAASVSDLADFAETVRSLRVAPIRSAGSLAAGREKKVLSRINLGAPMYATPVAVDNTLYISSRNYLWAVRQ